MDGIQSAIQFVRNHGNNVEQGRLNVLLQADGLVQESIEKLKRSQREDGSWSPFWAPNASSLDATCYRLAQTEQLGVKAAGFIDQAVSFIIGRQHQDGSFEEAPELASVAPPWAMPGDDSAKMYLTANAGYWIRYYRSSAPCVSQIQVFLISQMNDEGYLPTFLNANWLAAGLLYSLGDHKHAESIMNFLVAKLPELEASDLAWLINSLCVMGVSPDHQLISNAKTKLEQLQEEDGHWASEDGEWRDVHTTLECIRAMQFFVPSA
ncbi:prenyltransferase/squalene oxidase repeat-containing protein [Alicyclobacillus acidiphilus]|uniref:prenyltransferase/squalene oxidase repeat-containing protein n=1 Tax=Alicyclobacillus acidiphilus TaxID=182455 RepID=UPI00082FA052|nr:prenyltransferase/squalene oxidase repeat-containing protein [Alicyclobacillus acidiphilus]